MRTLNNKKVVKMIEECVQWVMSLSTHVIMINMDTVETVKSRPKSP